MRWVLLDAAIALFAVVFFFAVTLRLYRQVRDFGRKAGAAATRLNEASAALDEAQRQNPQTNRG